jgi:hypothetical protein
MPEIIPLVLLTDIPTGNVGVTLKELGVPLLTAGAIKIGSPITATTSPVGIEIVTCPLSSHRMGPTFGEADSGLLVQPQRLINNMKQASLSI